MTTSPIPAVALENHIAILAKTGAGKSNLAKTVVEDLLDRGERVCAIDPTGTWWGLRLMPDGSPSPYGILIMGGAHADIAISGRDGAAIAEVVGTSATSCIIDTRRMTVGERTLFFTDFAERLLQTNQGRLHLIIDEAHVFAPKGKVASPQSGQMLHAASNLISLGRGIGLSIMVLTQRPAKLHNDVLGCAETLVAMRMLLPHDKDAVSDWVKDNADPAKGREIRESLGGMVTGEFWLWAPTLDILERRKAPLVRTKDTGRPLPAEEAGVELAPVAVEDITARLAEVAAEVVANDPRRLKTELAQARAELARLQAEGAKAVVDEGAVEEAARTSYERGLEDGRAEGRAGLLSEVVDGLTNLADDLAQGTPIAAAAQRMPVAARASEPIRQPAPGKSTTAASVKQTAPRPDRAPPTPTVPRPQDGDVDAGDFRPTGPQQRLMAALRWAESYLRKDAVERTLLAFLAEVSASSSGFTNNLGALRAAGMLSYPASGEVALTPMGRAVAPEPPSLTFEDLRETVAGRLSRPQRAIFQEACAAHPAAVARPDLAEATGASLTSSGFTNNLGHMRTMGLIDYPAPGQVRAADWLFPEI